MKLNKKYRNNIVNVFLLVISASHSDIYGMNLFTKRVTFFIPKVVVGPGATSEKLRLQYKEREDAAHCNTPVQGRAA